MISYRKEVEACLTIDFDECSTIDEAIKKLEDAKIILQKLNAKEWKVHCNAPHDSGWIDIEYTRLETDEEYKKRLDKIETEFIKQQEKELRELERLKRKYENPS